MRFTLTLKTPPSDLIPPASELAQAAGRGISNAVKRHLVSRDARARSGGLPRSGYWGDAAGGVTTEVSGSLAVVTIHKEGAALHYYGGVVYPVMDVDRKTAIALGLVDDDALRRKVDSLRRKGSAQGASAPDFNANLQAAVPNLRSDSLCGEILKREFGDQVAIENSVVSWQGNLIQDVIAGRRKKAQLGVGYNGRPLPLSYNFFREHLSKHFGDNETNLQSVPLTIGDYELLPAVWRKPDRVTKSRDRDHLEFETFDGGLLHLFVSEQKGIRSFYKTKSGRSLQ